MKNLFTTHPAGADDIAAMVNLLQLLFEREAEFTPNPILQHNGLKLIIENKEIGQLLVLKHHEKVIGMINILFTISTALGGRVAIVEDVVLLPFYRNQGLGSVLINDAIEFAKQNHCLRLTLLTEADNLTAQAFYKKHGFTQSGMVPFRLML